MYTGISNQRGSIIAMFFNFIVVRIDAGYHSSNTIISENDISATTDEQ